MIAAHVSWFGLTVEGPVMTNTTACRRQKLSSELALVVTLAVLCGMGLTRITSALTFGLVFKEFLNQFFQFLSYNSLFN